MHLTTKDKVGLAVSILLGAAVGYFLPLAGYGGVLVGAVYAGAIVPIVVLFIADQRKILVWQACIVPPALWIVVAGARIGPLGIAGGLPIFFLFWAAGTVISSPVPIFLYWKRSKGRAGHRVVWLLLGLVLISLICSLLRDPFLFFGFVFAWTAVCLVKFSWGWRKGIEPLDAKAATLAALSVLVFAISSAALIGVFFRQGAFRQAVSDHHFGLARLFVSIGADPNACDAFGKAALIDAVWDGTGDLEAVNALIGMGANVNQAQPGALHGILPSGTALHVAAAAGRTEISQSLLRAGASVNAGNERGATPLLVALSHASLWCVPALLDYGADVNAKDSQGRTALMFLTMNYPPEDTAAQQILRKLLTRSADVNARDVDGKSAEDWAIYYKHDHFVEEIRSFRGIPKQVQN